VESPITPKSSKETNIRVPYYCAFSEKAIGIKGSI
jgi:hypothetical protein